MTVFVHLLFSLDFDQIVQQLFRISVHFRCAFVGQAAPKNAQEALHELPRRKGVFGKYLIRLEGLEVLIDPDGDFFPLTDFHHVGMKGKNAVDINKL